MMLQSKTNNQLIDNQFGFFIPGKKSNSSVKKKDSQSIFPAQTKVQEYADSSHLLNADSKFSQNQSLTDEQITKSRIRETVDKINSLRSKFEISNFAEVKIFLERNIFLVSLLEEISRKLYEFFGEEQKLALQVLHEPDFPDSSELWALVLTELSAREARSIMNNFDKDWWLENISKANCKLNVGIEYV